VAQGVGLQVPSVMHVSLPPVQVHSWLVLAMEQNCSAEPQSASARQEPTGTTREAEMPSTAAPLVTPDTVQ
jgi:hypothetical protein